MFPIKPFFQLIRYPNLIFIALTQWLFVYCIETPLFEGAAVQLNLQGVYLYLLILSFVLIAAGGNIINDYFDLNIDQINKPQKVFIGKYFNRRTALMLHLSLSFIGVFIGFYLDNNTEIDYLGWTNMAMVVLLFLYSAALKKKFLIGNIIISLLTAWVILVLPFCESNHIFWSIKDKVSLPVEKLLRLSILYASFAFIISLIREVIKDMEDMEGDKKYGCKTMPIVWGISGTKIFVSVWIVMLIALLLILQIYVLQFGWWISIAYCIAFVIYPLSKTLQKTIKSSSSEDYSQISRQVKWIMLAGILTMLFFIYYA